MMALAGDFNRGALIKVTAIDHRSGSDNELRCFSALLAIEMAWDFGHLKKQSSRWDYFPNCQLYQIEGWKERFCYSFWHEPQPDWGQDIKGYYSLNEESGLLSQDGEFFDREELRCFMGFSGSWTEPKECRREHTRQQTSPPPCISNVNNHRKRSHSGQLSQHQLDFGRV